MSTSSQRFRSDRGVALVEFAILAPLLFLIVFGIMEFGWGFSQYLDVRHGAREAARLAAVNYADPDNATPSEGGTQTGEIIEAACDRMGGDAIGAVVVLGFEDSTKKDLGHTAFIEVNSTFDTLTGFLDFALAGRPIKDKISFRLERDSTWDATSSGGVPC